MDRDKSNDSGNDTASGSIGSSVRPLIKRAYRRC